MPGPCARPLIITKINTRPEPKIIQALYRVSNAGIKVELIVRGAFVLRPDIPHLSENTRMRSIIGHFVEHTRIFYFYNGKAEDVRLSRALWMERNSFRRIEVCFPVLDRSLESASSWWVYNPI